MLSDVVVLSSVSLEHITGDNMFNILSVMIVTYVGLHRTGHPCRTLDEHSMDININMNSCHKMSVALKRCKDLYWLHRRYCEFVF